MDAVTRLGRRACLTVRLAARIPGPLKRRGALMLAALLLVVLVPLREGRTPPKPLGFAPSPAATAGMVERMQ